jgi:predicted nucleic acid-binding protein
MLRLYFDASALVKRYAAEDGTALVNEIFRRIPLNQFTCATIGVLEIVSVLVRKHNDGRLSPQLFGQAMLELNQEIIKNEAFVITAIEDSLIIEALALIGRHNLNATDAIILKSCLDFRAGLPNDRVILCTSDKRLGRAAHQEGLTVFDPEVDTLAQLENWLQE